MASKRIVAAREQRARERLTVARMAIVEKFGLEPPVPVRHSQDRDFDAMREIEVSADFFEGLASRLGLEVVKNEPEPEQTAPPTDEPVFDESGEPMSIAFDAIEDAPEPVTEPEPDKPKRKARK